MSTGKPPGHKRAPEMTKSASYAFAGGRPNRIITGRCASSKTFEPEVGIFVTRAHELKEEGNKLFQKREVENARERYDKALQLLPKDHVDIPYLRTNMASCYIQMGQYLNAIDQCNLALEVSPMYSKALLKRARCYESLNKFEFAFRDAGIVLNMEPANVCASEIFDRVKEMMQEGGVDLDEIGKSLANVQPVQPVGASRLRNVVREKLTNKKKRKKKKKNDKGEDKKSDRSESEGKKTDEIENEGSKGDTKETPSKKVDKKGGKGKKDDKGVGRKLWDKVVVEEKKKSSIVMDKEVIATKILEEGAVTKAVNKEGKVITRTVKLVFGEDIRWAQLPLNSSIRLARDIIRNRFPTLKGFLVKYKDTEGDLITITNTDELRLAESSCGSQVSLRLYIAVVSPDQEPLYDAVNDDEQVLKTDKISCSVAENKRAREYLESEKRSTCIENWIVQFALLFKNHVGIESDSYLDLHELAMKLYSEAMKNTVEGEDAQELFDIAADKFQEMAALAMFNWGNVHMSKARKQVSFPEDSSREVVLEKVEAGFQWAQEEYNKAAMRYEEALTIKPDFYEAVLALGLQQFEHAKLCWYHGLQDKVDLESEASQEVLKLYNKAENSMDRGMQIWEENKERCKNGRSKFDKYKEQLQKLGLDGLFREVSDGEAAEQTANLSSQICLLWGSLLYERSVVEYKLGLPTWDECLEVAVEKFEIAGASTTEIAVMIKNHSSNDNALEGMGFKIDEIAQAWHEMHDAKKWRIGVPTFRLEPLFRRRAPKLNDILEHVSSGCH